MWVLPCWVGLVKMDAYRTVFLTATTLFLAVGDGRAGEHDGDVSLSPFPFPFLQWGDVSSVSSASPSPLPRLALWWCEED
jgi:hypothetical protein